VEGLKPETREFRSKGLGNLVRIIAQYKHDNQNAEILINATGGYKAQISIGQGLDIPVFYNCFYAPLRRRRLDAPALTSGGKRPVDETHPHTARRGR